MKYIVDDVQNGTRPLELENLRTRGVFDEKPFVIVAVIGEDGFAKTTTVPGVAKASLFDRNFFQFHLKNATTSLRIDKPLIGRLTNKFLVRVSRRLNKMDGSFGGVLVVGIDEDFLIPNQNLINGFPINQALLDSNNNIIIEHGQDKVIFDFADSACSQYLKSNLLPSRCFKDNISRYIAVTNLSPFDYKIIVAINERNVITPLLTGNTEQRQILLAFSILIAASVLIAFITTIQLRLRDIEASNIRRAYRIATENGKEGFYLWKRILSPNGAIRDYRLVDCNEYGAALYQMSKKEILGKTFTDIYGETDYCKFVIETGIQMDKDGEGEAEFEIPKGVSVLQPNWIQRKYARTFEGVAVTIRDISEKKLNEIKLDRLANNDTLTGIRNRHWMMTSLPDILATAEKENSTIALFFIDLDDFKDINDSLGHAAGDEVLREVAQRISAVIREDDRVIRLGGDEFTVILNHASDPEYVSNIASRLIQSFKNPFQINNIKKSISASIGIARYPADGLDAETLIQKADMAMYAAKTQKGQYLFFSEELLQRRGHIIKIEDELRHAVKNNEFVIYYQPRISAKSGAIVGFEALVRWNSATRGLVQPIEFITLAENSDLIILIGEIVVEKVTHQIRAWIDGGLSVVPVSINVSARQFNASNIPGAIAASCSKESISASHIEVEITESAMMGSEVGTLAQLSKLAEMGIKTHVDDFGTGYSSLSMLRRLSLDVMKIDRAFATELDTSTECVILYKTMISMAHALGMKVVAEGVETHEQLAMLRSLECDELQGYLISKPLPVDEATLFLENKMAIQTAFWPNQIA